MKINRVGGFGKTKPNKADLDKNQGCLVRSVEKLFYKFIIAMS